MLGTTKLETSASRPFVIEQVVTHGDAARALRGGDVVVGTSVVALGILILGVLLLILGVGPPM